MRVAITSDIHGNMEAFNRVLEDISKVDVDLVINLGDSIGYGPEPETVLSVIQKENIPSLLGNHEKAIIDKIYLQYSMAGASKSIRHTMKFLTPALVAYIRKLPTFRKINGALFVHGCPPDSPTIYLNHLSFPEIENAFASFSRTICFVGHTHKLMLLSYNGRSIDFNPLKEETVPLDSRRKHIVNVGSVGQHRDGDPRAKYVIWDEGGHFLHVRRVTYDIAATAAKIAARGFLREDAERLF